MASGTRRDPAGTGKPFLEESEKRSPVVTNLLPEILERLGLYLAAFGVARYADIPDQDWPRVVQWLKGQVEPWRKT
ncbi:MAG: hypothetical protein ACXVCM_09155 [Ktedonobacteraceae bacterium]